MLRDPEIADGALTAIQDILEQAVESLSMPLAMYPRTASVEFQAGRLVSQAANIAISHRAVRIQSARQPGNTLQCLQFYHTLVLHTHAEDVASLVAAVRRQCSDMAQKVNYCSRQCCRRKCTHAWFLIDFAGCTCRRNAGSLRGHAAARHKHLFI